VRGREKYRASAHCDFNPGLDPLIAINALRKKSTTRRSACAIDAPRVCAHVSLEAKKKENKLNHIAFLACTFRYGVFPLFLSPSPSFAFYLSSALDQSLGATYSTVKCQAVDTRGSLISESSCRSFCARDRQPRARRGWTPSRITD